MAITDLTNTRWLFNETLDLSTPFNYSINYTTGVGESKSVLINDQTYLKVSSNSWIYDIYDHFVAYQFRTIMFTGGTDVTNPTLIAWLEANAKQITLNDLTNTKWTFLWDDINTSPDGKTFNLNFKTEGGVSHSKIVLESGYDQKIYYDETNVWENDDGEWFNTDNQTITITGGTDATSNDAIMWLLANATLVATYKTFDLSTLQLSAGTHTIQVKARATGFKDSNFSNSVNYVVESAGGTVTITIQSQYSTGSKYGFYVYDGQDDTGTLLFSEFDRYPTGDVTTTVNCTSGYLYISMSGGIVVFNGSATGGVTPASFGGYGQDNQLFTVNGNGTITFTDIDWDD